MANNIYPTLYIPTCDSNSFVLKYFQYFFNKYWGSHINVKILGFNKPNIKFDKNIEFISLGTEQIGGANGWSNYLIDFFSQLEDEYFMFGIDDFMICRPVDEEVFLSSLKLMSENIGRIDLQPLQWARHPSLFSDYKTIDGIQFFKMVQSNNGQDIYRNAGAFSIWNRKWFLKNIKRNWSPWVWEIEGSRMSENDGFEVIGSYNRHTIKKSELLSNQFGPFINTLGLRETDIKHMESMIEEDDRIKDFKSIGYETFGYQQYAGKDWLNKLYGE